MDIVIYIGPFCFFFFISCESQAAISGNPGFPWQNRSDSNSKQESDPSMCPEAAHCSLEASKSESCCQATVYRRGGVAGGGGCKGGGPSTAAHTPWQSFVIITSRLNLPGLELLIFFFRASTVCRTTVWALGGLHARQRVVRAAPLC